MRRPIETRCYLKTNQIDHDLDHKPQDKIAGIYPCRTDQIDHSLGKIRPYISLSYQESARPTYQIDHDLDHLDLNLPIWDVGHDLYGTDPTQENMCYIMQIIRLRPGNTSYGSFSSRIYSFPERFTSPSGDRWFDRCVHYSTLILSNFRF